MLYYITWNIDIEANSVQEAVLKALEIQRDPDSIATWFTVSKSGEKRELLIDANTLHDFSTSDHCLKCGVEQYEDSKASEPCDNSFITK